MCLSIPGEIVEVREDARLRFGKVRFGGILREVCLECVPDAAVGDFVLVHVGFAISKIDRDEAERAYQVLEEIGQLDDLLAGVAADAAGALPGDASQKGDPREVR